MNLNGSVTITIFLMYTNVSHLHIFPFLEQNLIIK